MTYTHIETVELDSSASSITFSSIPQDYDDLVIVASLRSSDTNAANDLCFISINGGSSNTTNVYLNGTGSSVGSGSLAGLLAQANGDASTSNTFNSLSAYIANYSSTTSHKSISSDSVNENNATAANQLITANLYASNTAITEIAFEPNIGPNWLAGSTISLYGVTAGGDGTVTTA